MKMSTVQAARALGWTSIALGAVEIFATKWVEKQIGVKDHEVLLRAFGAREIAAGVTILNNPGLNKTMTAGLWSRVFGDVLDLAALGAAATGTKNFKGWAAVTGFVVGALGLDVWAASMACRDLTHANRVAEAARKRVQPTQAIPDGGHPKQVTQQPQSDNGRSRLMATAGA